jgi:hypothetical protein
MISIKGVKAVKKKKRRENSHITCHLGKRRRRRYKPDLMLR